MTIALAILLVVHGLIHLLGAAKGFGWAELPQLTRPISTPIGGLWLLAAVLFLATAVAMFLWPRGWWAIGMAALVVSTIAIVPSWADAKFGAVANAIVAAAIAAALSVGGAPRN